MENDTKTEIQTEAQPEVKTTKCLNCGTEFEGNFCPECGQSADTGRFTWRFIIENLQSAIMGKDGGIWFTVKNLFSRPGAMIVEILNGKRKSYFSPFPMLFFVLALYVLILSFTGSNDAFREFEHEMLQPESSENVEMELDLNGSKTISLDSEKAKNYTSLFLGKVVSIYNNHYTLVYMLTLPLLVVAARACYGKSNRKRYYRAEYTVAIVYTSVIVVLYRCIVSLAYLVSPNVSGKMGAFMPLVIIIASTACFRKMMGFGIAKTAWRSVLSTALYYLLLGVLLIIGVAILIFYLAMKVR
jgi:hypothetical protein